MGPAGHLDPAHNPGLPGLNAIALGGPPGHPLHPNPPPASRQPLGPVSAAPVGELTFGATTGVMGLPVSGAGEAPEPALDVSMGPHTGERMGAGVGGNRLPSPGSTCFPGGDLWPLSDFQVKGVSSGTMSSSFSLVSLYCLLPTLIYSLIH